MGPPARVSADEFSAELDNFDSQYYAGSYNGGQGAWLADIRPTAANSLINGQTAAFAGLQITTSDTRKLIRNLTIELSYGTFVGPSGDLSNVLGGRFQQNVTGNEALTNFYIIAPILKEEADSQRTQLVNASFAFAAGTTPPSSTGVRWKVTGLANDPAYEVRAFLPNRGIGAMVSVGRYYNAT
jgi:hypothetical protein